MDEYCFFFAWPLQSAFHWAYYLYCADTPVTPLTFAVLQSHGNRLLSAGNPYFTSSVATIRTKTLDAKTFSFVQRWRIRRTNSACVKTLRLFGRLFCYSHETLVRNFVRRSWLLFADRFAVRLFTFVTTHFTVQVKSRSELKAVLDCWREAHYVIKRWLPRDARAAAPAPLHNHLMRSTCWRENGGYQECDTWMTSKRRNCSTTPRERGFHFEAEAEKWINARWFDVIYVKPLYDNFSKLPHSIPRDRICVEILSKLVLQQPSSFICKTTVEFPPFPDIFRRRVQQTAAIVCFFLSTKTSYFRTQLCATGSFAADDAFESSETLWRISYLFSCCQLLPCYAGKNANNQITLSSCTPSDA